MISWRARQEAQASTEHVEQLQAKYEAEVKPRLEAQMQQQVQEQAMTDRPALIQTLENLRSRKAQEEAILAEARQRRAGMWFWEDTSMLDTSIEMLERSIPERQQAIERIERALQQTKE